MQLKYTCDCGHLNLWKIRFDRISDFVCQGCNTFHGSCNGKEVKFVEPTERDKFSLVDDEPSWHPAQQGLDGYYYTGSTSSTTHTHYYGTCTSSDRTW